jgi:group I intron endonuclease
MSNKKYNYVYVTTNLISGKKYIGSHSSNDINNDYLGSGTALKKDIKYFGKQFFSKKIIAIYDTREQAYQVESELLNDMWFSTDTYNIYKTTSGLISHTEDTRLKMSKSKGGENNPMFGKPSPNKGKAKSALSKILISKALSGGTSKPKHVKHKLSGIVYNSIREAADAFDIKYPNLKQQLIRGSFNCEFEYHTEADNDCLTSNSNVQ